SLTSLFFFSCSAPHPALHSFPTRRSSDLHRPDRAGVADVRYHRPTRDVHGRPERHRRVLPALAGEPGQSRADARGREEIFVSARTRAWAPWAFLGAVLVVVLVVVAIGSAPTRS